MNYNLWVLHHTVDSDAQADRLADKTGTFASAEIFSYLLRTSKNAPAKPDSESAMHPSKRERERDRKYVR